MTWNKSKDVFALMVGHGRSLDGTWDCGCTYGKYTEAGLMLGIIKVAVKWLRKSGVKVITDADDANNRNMKASVAWANNKKAKYYMSVHCDYQKASAGVYPLYVSAKGKRMADKIGKRVAKSMGMKYKGACKRTDLYELNATNMPSVILETGSIKADLKYLKQYKKYGRALAKAICKYIGVEIYVYNRIKLLRKMAYIIAYMNSHHFKYTPKGKDCAFTWAGAKKKKKTNCCCTVCYGMQECGFLKPGQIFWCNGEKVSYIGKGTEAQLKKVARITHPNKVPKTAKPKRGYITGTKNNPHTMVFAGWVKSGKNKHPVWYSWSPTDAGKKQPKHKPSYDNKKINTFVILKN